MRLIDADTAIEKFNDDIAIAKEDIKTYKDHRGGSYEKYMYYSALGRISRAKQKIKFFNSIRTAYDVDKVVEQLEICKNSFPFGTWHDMVEEAVNIVKGGGRDE